MVEISDFFETILEIEITVLGSFMRYSKFIKDGFPRVNVEKSEILARESDVAWESGVDERDDPKFLNRAYPSIVNDEIQNPLLLRNGIPAVIDHLRLLEYGFGDHFKD